MRTLLGLATVVAIAVTAVSDVTACGDKYLVPGRGARFQPTPAERERAALLFYAPPTSALARTLARLKSETALRKAGYRPTLVTTPADLARVASTTWDVVLVDAADGGVVKQQIPASGRAQVVAVLAGATAIQTALARAEFPVVLKSPSRNQDLLDALDAAAGQTFANHAKAAAAKGR